MQAVAMDSLIAAAAPRCVGVLGCRRLTDERSER